HRRDVAGEQDAGARIGAVLGKRGERVGGGMEVDLHLGRHRHAIELLFPVARRNGVVDEDDESDVERLPPTDDDLAVDQAVVDPVEHERHAPAPCTLIAARPRSAACRAASGAERASANTKSSSVGRFAPATSTASSMPRRMRRDAMVQLPACRSVKITRTLASSSLSCNSFSMSATVRSLIEIGMSCPPRPVICSTADTRPKAKSPCPATIALGVTPARVPLWSFVALLIVLLQIAEQIALAAHLPHEPFVE